MKLRREYLDAIQKCLKLGDSQELFEARNFLKRKNENEKIAEEQAIENELRYARLIYEGLSGDYEDEVNELCKHLYSSMDRTNMGFYPEASAASAEGTN